MANQVEVKGLGETVNKLTKLGATVGDLKEVMTKVGQVVAVEAEALAPRKTGSLAATIRANKAKNKAIVRAGSARVPYAGVQNFGGYHGITGQHFMERALEAKQGAAIQELESGLGALIRTSGL